MASVDPNPSSSEHPASVSVSVSVPSYSRWFSYKKISECEYRMLPELLDGSKNPRVYKYLRNSIVRRYRLNPTIPLSFSDVRKTLVGDVASIRRVFDFLDTWGLINYSPPPCTSVPPTPATPTNPPPPPNNNNNAKPDDVTAAATPPPPDADPALHKRRTCGGCKSACSVACFSCDKYDLILCARCYVRGNYRTGVSSTDFRRIEISEDQKRDWTHKEMLLLLEAVTHFGDDWKKVSQLVGGKTDKECIAQFIKLPFGEEYSGYADLGDADTKYHPVTTTADHSVDGVDGGGSLSPCKRPHLTPLADASNPIMAQSAFLSALAGNEVAEAAARAAVATLTDIEYGVSRTVPRNQKQQDASNVTNGNSDLSTLERASLEANSLLEREETGMEQLISDIVQVQMKEIQEKLVRFEKLDLQMEKEWQQFEQQKNLLFVDQLTLLFNHRSSATNPTDPKDEMMGTD